VPPPISDARWQDYVRARAVPEDAFLRELREAAVAAGIPTINVPPEQGAFLHVLLLAARAVEVVEVGALAGYSAIWMARALPEDGRVRTIEASPHHANFAETWIARSDVAGKIEVHRGDARAVLPRFADASADAAFIDADKAGYPEYLTECLRILRPGGLVIADNAFAFGQLLDDGPVDPDVEHLRRFNDTVAQTPGLRALIVPIGDGCWVGVKTDGTR